MLYKTQLNPKQACGALILFCRMGAWLSVTATALAVAILGGFLLWRGAKTLSLGLIFGDTPILAAITGKAPVWEGLWPACVGSLCLVVLSSALAIPVGLASGIYLARFAPARFKRVLVLGTDLLAGIPSIVMGLFGFTLILLLRRTFLPGATTCLILAAGCLGLLILPYLIGTTRNVIESLPVSLSLTGAALGLSPWQQVVHVLLPAAVPGLLGGVLLAVSRAIEDTAVILLTGVVANAGLPAGLTGKFEALPFAIFYLAAQYQSPAELDRGFGAALILLALTWALFQGAGYCQRILVRRWTVR